MNKQDLNKLTDEIADSYLRANTLAHDLLFQINDEKIKSEYALVMTKVTIALIELMNFFDDLYKQEKLALVNNN